MANVKISDLAAATVVNNTDQVEINQGGTSKSATALLVRGSNTIVDISAGNQTQALAAPTGSGQKVRLGWNGGDGTFTAQLTGYTLYFPDGTGLTAAQAAGEGDGFMEVQDIGSQWEMIAYEDRLVIASGNTGEAVKYYNGNCDQIRTGVSVTAYPTAVTCSRTFISAPSDQEHVASRTDSIALYVSRIDFGSASGFDLRIADLAGGTITTGTHDVRMDGRWY